MSDANSTSLLPRSAGKPPRHPFLLQLVEDILLGLSFIGWVRMVQAIAGWDLQVELLGRPMAFYLVLSGALWGLAGLAATLLLQFRSGWAVPAAWVGTIFFPLSFWLERIFFVRSPQDWINWPFMLGLTLVWLALVIFTITRRSTRIYLAKEKPLHE